MSFSEWFSTGIMWVMAIGALLGGIDNMIGNKFGLGEKFEEGFNSMGPLALGMVGIICLAPVMADYLGMIVVPVLTAMNADPAIFGAILPNDSGGYPLAMELALDKNAGLFAGLLVASMLGCTVTFSIPVGLSLIEKWDQPFFAKGLLVGFIAIPVGSLAGGIIGGFDTTMVLWNTLPVTIASILLIVGLIYIPEGMIKGCMLFGKIIFIIVTFGTMTAAFISMSNMTEIIFPAADGGLEAFKATLGDNIGSASAWGGVWPYLVGRMAPVAEAMEIIGAIGVVLLGTFPVLSIITKVLGKPLGAIGAMFNLDPSSTAGIIFTTANPIPTFKMIKDMNPRGKIINTAWIVPATATLGDHLGFTAGVEPDHITMVVLGKFVGGALALILALMWTKSTEMEERQSAEIRQRIEAKAASS